MSETKKSEAYRTGLMASDYTDYPEFPYTGAELVGCNLDHVNA